MVRYEWAMLIRITAKSPVRSSTNAHAWESMSATLSKTSHRIT
jgi:hypothetical protein